MFHSALNAPWLLIILYMLLLAALGMFLRGRYYAKRWYADNFSTREAILVLLAAILFGAGLALLGAAYLHDVWYC